MQGNIQPYQAKLKWTVKSADHSDMGVSEKNIFSVSILEADSCNSGLRNNSHQNNQ